jgi:aminoglycoside phosphotransferase (APT) family kinase protein
VDRLDLGFVNRGRPIGLAGELTYWDDYFAFAAVDGLGPTQTRAWDWLRANPPDGDTALCWGDARVGNQVFDGTRCAAILDWEMACLSDPMQDLAWYCHFEELFTDGLGVPKQPGVPTTEETIAHYEELTGRPVHDFGYFHLFAALRFAVILERLGRLQIATGKLPGDSTFPTDNFAVDHLATLCDRNGI